MNLHIAKTASLKTIDKTYLEFLQSLGSELEARNQLLLSIGYQPVSTAEEVETVPMVKAQLLTCLLYTSALEAAWAMGALPRPASLENTPRAKP